MTAKQIAGVLSSIVLVSAGWYVLGARSQDVNDLSRTSPVESAGNAGTTSTTEEAPSGFDSSLADLSGYPPPLVPTQTTIPPGEGMYDGWTDQEIADDLITMIDADDFFTPPAGPDGEPPEPTIWIASADVTPDDAGNFGMPPDSVSFQSPTDIAMLFSGTFTYSGPGMFRGAPKPQRYLLVVVDRASGSWRSTSMSNDRQSLMDRMP